MGDFSSVTPNSEGEQHVIAAMQHLVKALGASKNLSEQLSEVLADFDIKLSQITAERESKENRYSEIEEQFKQAETKILSWESNPNMVWDSGPGEAAEYLQAIYEIQRLIESFGGKPGYATWYGKTLSNQAESVLQIAMIRLEKELLHILAHQKRYFEPDYMSFRSRVDGVTHNESFVSVEDEPVVDEPVEDEPVEEDVNEVRRANELEEYVVDLVCPCAIPNLKSIATAMFSCSYDKEFCEAFINTRRDALDESLAILKFESFGIEDMLKMEWNSMNGAAKRWTFAMKIIIRVYLASEKRLCEQILGDFDPIDPVCFIEISKTSILSLLNFGEAMSMGPNKPERLFCLLDMYEVLADLLEDIDELLSVEAGSWLRIEFHELLKRLSDSIGATFKEFRNAIATDESFCPFPGGGIHHITKYVMNYIMTFLEYADSLEFILKDIVADDPTISVVELEYGLDIPPLISCPMACHLWSITSTLESVLHNKSQLYKGEPLQFIFLMNNIHYMVQKVKGSELRSYFGDQWIRKHNGKFQNHAKNYERATWSSVICLLKEDQDRFSNHVSKVTLKGMCKEFTIAFEEVYKSQTRWFIPDLQLREDLQISVSLKVIHAYRTFLGRNGGRINEKDIKYTDDDLANMILELFERSSPRSLRNSRRS